MEISFGTYKPRSTQSVRKLMLEKDEQARVCFLDDAPRLVYVHTFEKVVVGPDGKPIEIEDGEWADGRKRIKTKTEYAGKLRCLGQDDTLEVSGVDPENCAACRAHIETPNAVRAPQRRFLGKVLKYTVRQGTFNVAKPFSATLLVWDLTEKRFGELASIHEEHGNLQEKDLLLGPCEIKQMQKYNIQPGGDKAAWLASADTMAYVKELLAEEAIDDVEAVAAKTPTEFELETKVKEVVRAYNHAFGVPSATSYDSILGSSNLDQVAAPAADTAAAAPAAAETPVEEQGAPEAEDTSAGGSEETGGDDSTDSTPSLEELLAKLGS